MSQESVLEEDVSEGGADPPLSTIEPLSPFPSTVDDCNPLIPEPASPFSSSSSSLSSFPSPCSTQISGLVMPAKEATDDNDSVKTPIVEDSVTQSSSFRYFSSSPSPSPSSSSDISHDNITGGIGCSISPLETAAKDCFKSNESKGLEGELTTAGPTEDDCLGRVDSKPGSSSSAECTSSSSVFSGASSSTTPVVATSPLPSSLASLTALSSMSFNLTNKDNENGSSIDCDQHIRVLTPLEIMQTLPVLHHQDFPASTASGTSFLAASDAQHTAAGSASQSPVVAVPQQQRQHHNLVTIYPYSQGGRGLITAGKPQQRVTLVSQQLPPAASTTKNSVSGKSIFIPSVSLPADTSLIPCTHIPSRTPSPSSSNASVEREASVNRLIAASVVSSNSSLSGGSIIQTSSTILLPSGSILSPLPPPPQSHSSAKITEIISSACVSMSDKKSTMEMKATNSSSSTNTCSSSPNDSVVVTSSSPSHYTSSSTSPNSSCVEAAAVSPLMMVSIKLNFF